MIHIYVKGYNDMNANVVAVIVNNLVKYENELNLPIDCIGSLDGISTSDTVIPFGPRVSKELIATGYEKNFSLMVDAISLGYLNKIKHYLKVGHFLHKDFLYSIYAYLKYKRKEKRMVESFDTNILVSTVDIDYFKKHINPSDSKYQYVTNGIDLYDTADETFSNTFRIGILSTWHGRQIFE